MKIRSITYFFNPGWSLDEGAFQKAGAFARAARSALQDAGYEVQTVRLATIPFAHLALLMEGAQMLQMAQGLEQAAKAQGYDYLSLGPALPDNPASYAVIPSVLANTENVFMAGLMTVPEGGVVMSAVAACADIIHKAARLSPDGFTNLRFAALANVPPGGPFFPAAYHHRDAPSFALATEAADLAVEAFSQASNLHDARLNLVSSVEAHAEKLGNVAQALSNRFEIAYGGIDFTLAPFPDVELSFGTAMERMGVPAVGLHGSLAAAAILADTLDRADFPKAGFNGLMLPVLEDATLALRAAEGSLTIKDLLLYSTVCGTGLDTVPLPGDTSVEALHAILLDLAVLSQRLDKPLTARLMPIPGKMAGDPTGFDFAYFANSRVLALESNGVENLLAGQETISLGQRPAN